MDKSIDLIKTVITPKDYIVVGCSGGPDSMCLLTLLYKEGYKTICAHINHNIREESKSEQEFLRQYCEKYKIPFETLTLPKDETHDEAYYRRERYTFYKHLADKYKTQYIMTAHHGDDLIETVLMRISRGSHLKGYMGFPKCYDEHGYKFIKPLIYYTKADIEAYNEQNDIPYVHDKTNDEDIYTRNRYRHNILPFLKEENRAVHLKYLKYSEELEASSNYIEQIVAKALAENYKDRKIDLNLFNLLDPFIKTKELEMIFKDIYKDDIDKLKTSHIKNIIDMLETDHNFKLNLPNSIVVKREYDHLYIAEFAKEINAYCIEFNGRVELPNGDIIETSEDTDDTSNFTTRLNAKDLTLPLYIRTRKQGDKIEVKNMDGSKKIKNIFIDEKVKPSMRDTYPILVDANDTVLWLPGLRKSKFDNEKKQKYDIILKYTRKKGNLNEKK